MKHIRITEKTGTLDFGYSCVPFHFLNPHEIVLFDSGMKPMPGIFDQLDADGIRVAAVLHTHLHDDHMGNNAIIRERYGAAFFAHEREIAFAEEVRQGGDVRYRSFDRASVTPFDDSCRELVIQDTAFRLLPTPGHSAGHTAFLTPDGVCCVGDCFISGKFLAISKIPYMQNIEASLTSMLQLADTTYPLYITSHKGPVAQDQLKKVIFDNILLTSRLSLSVAELADRPIRRDVLADRVFEKLKLTHLRDVEWICFMVDRHIDKALARRMLTERNGLLCKK